MQQLRAGTIKCNEVRQEAARIDVVRRFKRLQHVAIVGTHALKAAG